MKRVSLFLPFVVLLFVVPGHLHATLFPYEVYGQMEFDQKTYTVTGSLLIDDTLRLWGEGGSPAQPAIQIGNDQYSYFISRYSLCLLDASSLQDTCLFKGYGGNFYMERLDGSMGDTMWFFENGRGGWDEWYGEEFYFYHLDWTPYDLYTEIDVLAPCIRLVNACDMRCGQDLTSATVDITLSRAAPVPEPATLVLMGLGLAGLAGCGRKFRP